MSMAEKKRKLMAQRQAQTPSPAPPKPHLERASVMVLAAQDEVDVATRPLPPWPEVDFEPDPDAGAGEVAPPAVVEGSVQAGGPSPVAEPEGQGAGPSDPPIRLQVARVQPSIPAEKVGAAVDSLLRGLQAKGAGTRTLRLSIPYSLRLDAELYRLLHAHGPSAAATAQEAFREAPKDNPDAVTGAAALVAERRRRPSKGGLGQAGTVTLTLDGPASETLEVLARRAGLSCGAFLEGSVLIWAVRNGFLEIQAR